MGPGVVSVLMHLMTPGTAGGELRHWPAGGLSSSHTPSPLLLMPPPLHRQRLPCQRGWRCCSHFQPACMRLCLCRVLSLSRLTCPLCQREFPSLSSISLHPAQRACVSVPAPHHGVAVGEPPPTMFIFGSSLRARGQTPRELCCPSTCHFCLHRWNLTSESIISK